VIQFDSMLLFLNRLSIYCVPLCFALWLCGKTARLLYYITLYRSCFQSELLAWH